MNFSLLSHEKIFIASYQIDLPHKKPVKSIPRTLLKKVNYKKLLNFIPALKKTNGTLES